jgi:hypothetical protein
MRPLGIGALAAVLLSFSIHPSGAETTPKQPKAKQVAQRQIICTMAIRGCREVKPGCRVENMPSKDHDASGHQKEVCPGD